MFFFFKFVFATIANAPRNTCILWLSQTLWQSTRKVLFILCCARFRRGRTAAGCVRVSSVWTFASRLVANSCEWHDLFPHMTRTRSQTERFLRCSETGRRNMVMNDMCVAISYAHAHILRTHSITCGVCVDWTACKSAIRDAIVHLYLVQ